MASSNDDNSSHTSISDMSDLSIYEEWDEALNPMTDSRRARVRKTMLDGYPELRYQKELHKSLSKDEREILYELSVDDFPPTDDNIGALHELFSKVPKLTAEMKVYRGISIPPDGTLDLGISLYASTSLSYSSALQFSESRRFNHKATVLCITLPIGTNTLWQSENVYYNEVEMLLPPGKLYETSRSSVTNNDVTNIFVTFEQLPLY